MGEKEEMMEALRDIADDEYGNRACVVCKWALERIEELEGEVVSRDEVVERAGEVMRMVQRHARRMMDEAFEAVTGTEAKDA